MKRKVGLMGGTALAQVEGLSVHECRRVSTPFGDPSDELVIGSLEGVDVVFLHRHGKKHTLLPTEINYRANIFAFKELRVDTIISVSAVGSLKEEIRPLDVVLVDQFIDRTNQARATSFFGAGAVAHIPFADPVCGKLRNAIYRNNSGKGFTVHNGGTYLNMEGPAFSTRAESRLYRSWGADVIGMTNMAEARLAREAGMCYATVAMVTDYDCWHEGPERCSVSVDVIMENLARNVETARKMIRNTVAGLPAPEACDCRSVLKNSLVTRREDIPQETLETLRPILGDVC